MGDPVVSVIVPVRNGPEHLSALLAALERQTLPRARFEVLIGDDGSTDGCTDGLESGDGWLRVLPGPPLNSYAARNRAARAARAPVLAFCDADCQPEPKWLEAGLAALADADLAAGLIKLLPPARRTVWALLDMDSFKDHEVQVRHGTAETANLFVRRPRFDELGGFDDSLPEHGDFDFVARAVAAGARLVFAKGAVVTHPTRHSARSLLRAIWIYNRWYAARESRAGRLPEGLKLRSWVPLVQPLRARRRFGRSLGPDRRWLAVNGMQPTRLETLRALPVMHLLVPYLCEAAQLRGWRDGRKLRRAEDMRADVLLACSSGGHLLQLLALRPAWEGFSRVWVTEDASDSRSLLDGERAIFAHPPSTRSVSRLLRDFPLAWRLLRRVRPKVVLTTGAGAALPFVWLGRVRGSRVVYVETVTRIAAPSLSCRLVAPIADRVYIQWPELQQQVRGARYAGTVLGAG